MSGDNLFKRGSIILILLGLALSLQAASVQVQPMFEDPYGSQQILEGRQFLRELGSEEAESAKQLDISLVTMGKGDPLYIWFGHSGLTVTESSSGRSVMYDYGIFSFDDNFYQTFALGRLNYEVWATSFPARIGLAIEEDRDIYEISLNLPDSAKLEILKLLNYNIQDGRNVYLYHHYRENCSTRIRDIIDKATGGQLYEWSRSIPMEETLRQLVMRHTYASPFIDWTLNFLQSGSIDKPITLWEAMFLPSILESAIMEFTYLDASGAPVPLAGERTVHHLATAGIRAPVLDTWKSMTWAAGLFAFALGLLSIVLGGFQALPYLSPIAKLSRFLHGILNFSWTAATGVLSVLLVFMMTASNHDVTYFNENVLFVTPYLLVMAVQALRSAFGNRGSLARFRKANTVFAIISVAIIMLKLVFLDLMIQQNWQILFTVLPLYVCNSVIPFERLFVRKRRIIDDSDF